MFTAHYFYPPILDFRLDIPAFYHKVLYKKILKVKIVNEFLKINYSINYLNPELPPSPPINGLYSKLKIFKTNTNFKLFYNISIASTT